MALPTRTPSVWPGWLTWALPAGIGAIVTGYQVVYQVVIDPARSAGIFWSELLVFGIAGPLVAWLLLRQLALDAAARDAAAQRISALVAEERRRAEEARALVAISTAMNQAMSEEEALSGALRSVMDEFGFDGGRIYLLDARSGVYTIAATQGDLQPLNAGEVVVPGACPCGRAARTREPQQATGGAADLYIVDPCRAYADRACASVPLLAKEHVVGLMHLIGRREDGFAEGEKAVLRAVGAQIGMALENMRLREEARRAEGLSTLIQEMHHRIKNNLQTVADLLSLEMSASPSPAARKSLRDSINRIKSIAAVHELLSLEQLRLTDITELARQVCDISLKHMLRPDHHVTAEISGPAIYLPSKQATALALVMNELIANALEHAFSLNGRDGRLAITLAQDGAQVTVTIADNGRGLPPGFPLSGRRGLGLQIVEALVTKDLAGTLELGNRAEGGSQAKLTFYK